MKRMSDSMSTTDSRQTRQHRRAMQHRRRMLHRDQTLVGRIVMYTLLFGVTLLSLIPVVWVVMSSFKTNAEILNSAVSFPSHFGFEGYAVAFHIAPILTFFVNSVVVTSVSTVLNLLLVGMAAYVIALFDFKGKTLVLILLSTSLLLPMTALIQPVYMVVSKLGLYNSLGGLILVYSSLGLPTTLFIMRGYFLSLPTSLMEAAYIDGAGFLKTFLSIMLPSARPGLATAAVLQFLMAWNEFLYALVLTNSNSSRTLPIALNYFKSQFSFNYTAMFAAIVVVIIPSILVYVVLQKQVVSGLTSGAVKG
jgi:raffinose/stachyose/melibiose transport system permease protein